MFILFSPWDKIEYEIKTALLHAHAAHSSMSHHYTTQNDTFYPYLLKYSKNIFKMFNSFWILI